jgi:tyrosyl-tRNA synthetase
LVHGPEAADAARAASEVLFGGSVADLDEATLAVLVAEVPTVTVDRRRLLAGVDPVELFAESGIAASKGEARRLLEQRGWSVNGTRLEPGARLDAGFLLHGRYALVRRGRSGYHVLVAG